MVANACGANCRARDIGLAFSKRRADLMQGEPGLHSEPGARLELLDRAAPRPTLLVLQPIGFETS